MWLLYATLSASLLTLAAAGRCCPDAEVFLALGRRCSDTPDHQALTCPKFLLNGRTEKFTVLSDGRLQHGRSVIASDRYCVTPMIGKDGVMLENEIAFVCFPDQSTVTPSPEAESKKTHHILMGCLLLVSVLFMAAMLLVYALLPDMRDLEGKCLTSAVFNLSIAFLLLGIMQFTASDFDAHWCQLMAFLLYFWMLAAFFWLNIVSYNMWRCVVCEPSSEAALYVKYRLYGWGCPLLFVSIALLLEHLPQHLTAGLTRPDFGRTSCWFHDNTSIWYYFYGPVAVLLAANLVLFVWTAVKLWRDESTHRQHLHSLRFKCTLYAKLFIIMGITWIFELISNLHDRDNTSYIWMTTDIINALQGVLIFLVTVVCRRRVLRGLSQRQTCGIPWPQSWAAGVDAESHAILATTDVEMTLTSDKILS